MRPSKPPPLSAPASARWRRCGPRALADHELLRLLGSELTGAPSPPPESSAGSSTTPTVLQKRPPRWTATIMRACSPCAKLSCDGCARASPAARRSAPHCAAGPMKASPACSSTPDTASSPTRSSSPGGSNSTASGPYTGDDNDAADGGNCTSESTSNALTCAGLAAYATALPRTIGSVRRRSTGSPSSTTLSTRLRPNRALVPAPTVELSCGPARTDVPAPRPTARPLTAPDEVLSTVLDRPCEIPPPTGPGSRWCTERLRTFCS